MPISSRTTKRAVMIFKKLQSNQQSNDSSVCFCITKCCCYSKFVTVKSFFIFLLSQHFAYALLRFGTKRSLRQGQENVLVWLKIKVFWSPQKWLKISSFGLLLGSLAGYNNAICKMPQKRQGQKKLQSAEMLTANILSW